MGTGSIVGIHAENFTEIGFFGTVGTSGNNAIVFEGCNFSRNSINSGYMFVNLMHTVFIGCQFRLNTARSSNMNIIGNAFPVVFDNCTIAYTGTDPRRSLYASVGNGKDLYSINGTRLCFGIIKDISSNLRVNSLPVVQELSPQTQQVYDSSTGKLYIVSRMSELVSFSAGNRNLSADKLTLTFTVTASLALLFAVGDWISWQVGYQAVSGTFTVFYRVPSFKVDSISGTTISCSCLHDAIFLNPGSETILYIFRENFINATLATATVTSGSNILSAVTDIANFAVGNWVQGTGLAINSRITAIDTTANTLTLNYNATVSGTLIEVYNSKLVALN
jgi:hypothetical protein